MKVFVADIGGTSIKTGVFKQSKNITHFKEYPTKSSLGGRHVLNTLINIIYLHDDIDAIGVSTAGQVDYKLGAVIHANKNFPGYTGINIKNILEKEFNVPTKIENDAKAAALGELAYGAGKSISDFLCLTYGTGVGGAIIYDNKLYRGDQNIAGNFGHIITSYEDYYNHQRGFYEDHASTTALVSESKKIDKTCVNGKKIIEKINEGNFELQKVFELWIDKVIVGLISIIHIFNPQTIILGGGIMENKNIIEKIEKRVKKKLLPNYNLNLLKAELGNKAGLIGAGILHIN